MSHDTVLGLGFWRGADGEHADEPDVRAFIDAGWDDARRERVWNHLSASPLRPEVAAGISICRLCGARNGCAERTDGTYLWPEGLAHYVAAHDVRLPEDFVEHVHRAGTPPVPPRARPAIDMRWWRAAHIPTSTAFWRRTRIVLANDVATRRLRLFTGPVATFDPETLAALQATGSCTLVAAGRIDAVARAAIDALDALGIEVSVVVEQVPVPERLFGWRAATRP